MFVPASQVGIPQNTDLHEQAIDSKIGTWTSPVASVDPIHCCIPAPEEIRRHRAGSARRLNRLGRYSGAQTNRHNLVFGKPRAQAIEPHDLFLRQSIP